MTLRSRLTVLAAAAVAVAVALAAVLVYVAARSVLRGEVDDALQRQAVLLSQAPLGAACLRDVFPELPRPRFGGPEGYVQIVCAGDVVREPGEAVGLPVSGRTQEVAVGEEDPFFADATVRGVHLRVLTTPVRGGAAIQVARPLDEVDRVLRGLRNVLVLVTLGGIGIAAALGLLVSGSALTPIRRLTEATEHVAETRDLRSRIEVTGRDELSRLASSFNEMLEALDASLAAQRRLVADASHELRTPLTSLRTNVEVLTRPDAPAGEERERLLRDVVDQTAELTRLVEDVVELARGHEPAVEETDVRLDEVVAAAVARAERDAPHVRFRTELDDSVVRGVPSRIDRAVSNLLDNAAKWSPPGGEVDVVVRAGEVTVRDRGPGIAEEDLPHVFDRFYRSAAARRLPGSGLGLAIVRQVAEAHGGSVSAEAAPGGGALLRLRLGATVSAHRLAARSRGVASGVRGLDCDAMAYFLRYRTRDGQLRTWPVESSSDQDFLWELFRDLPGRVPTESEHAVVWNLVDDRKKGESFGAWNAEGARRLAAHMAASRVEPDIAHAILADLDGG